MMIGLDVVIVSCVLANAAGLVAAAMTVYWRHTAPAGPRLLSIVVGVLLGAVLLAADFVHSLVDGALIVAALAVGIVPGAVATLAVALHEVPRRIATVTLLVRAGCRPAVALGLAVCAGLGTVLGGTLAWLSAEAIRPALPVALALSAAAMLYVALAQSVSLFGVWRARVLTLECGLPLLAGVLIIDGSHHVLELFG